MKKLFFPLLFSFLLLASCSSDDENGVTLNFVEDTFLVDADAIVALPAGSDISFLVDFGQPIGQSAANWETEVELNDVFLLRAPGGLGPNDEFLYSSLFFLDENQNEVPTTDPDELVVGGLVEAIVPPGIAGISAVDFYAQNFLPAIALQVINGNSSQDTNWKYDIECYIRRNGVLNGPYTIDPKLKIKRLN